jgi:hypothetical protein
VQLESLARGEIGRPDTIQSNVPINDVTFFVR